MMYDSRRYREQLADEIRHSIDHHYPLHLTVRTLDGHKEEVLSIIQKYGKVYGVEEYSPSFALEPQDKEIADLIETNSLKGVKSVSMSQSFIELCCYQF